MTAAYLDPRLASRERLLWQLAGAQDSSRANHELADRLIAEFERDFPGAHPQDRERYVGAVRRATAT